MTETYKLKKISYHARWRILRILSAKWNYIRQHRKNGNQARKAFCVSAFCVVKSVVTVAKSSRAQPPRSPDLTVMESSSEGLFKACLCPSVVDDIR